MKKTKKLKIACIKTAVFFLFAVAVISCSTNDTPKEKEAGITDYYITAKIDGVETSINENVIAIPRDDEGYEYYVINISNNLEADYGFGLFFPRAEGTFSTAGITALAYSKATENSSSVNVWAANEYTESSGSITITKINDTFIEGTFFFTGESFDGSTISVTEGKFKALNP